MGYLYYGNYGLYYEVARAEAMRALGITYKYQEEVLGIMMPVVTMNTRYIRPAFYDELLTITSELRQMPEDFMRFHYIIKNEAGKLLNGGEVKLVFVDKNNGKRVKAPEYLLEKLRPFFPDSNK
jgi:acyl-CoA thioester hydrolase